MYGSLLVDCAASVGRTGERNFAGKEFSMTDTSSPQPLLAFVSDDASRLAQHLLHYPADLIDARHLMHRFQVSVAEVQQVFRWLEQNSLPAEGETRGE
jgi:hypothetical protein